MVRSCRHCRDIDVRCSGRVFPHCRAFYMQHAWGLRFLVARLYIEAWRVGLLGGPPRPAGSAIKAAPRVLVWKPGHGRRAVWRSSPPWRILICTAMLQNKQQKWNLFFPHATAIPFLLLVSQHTNPFLLIRGSGLGLPPVPTGSLGLYGGSAPMPPTKKLNFHKSFSADALIIALKCKKIVTKTEERPPILRRNSDHCPTKKNLYLCRR